MHSPDNCSAIESAGAALYERYARSIFAYVRLHTSSWEDAEDLVFEVFTAALEQDNLAFLTNKQQLVWLRRVAQNKLVDRYRRSSRIAVLPLEQVEEDMLTQAALTPEQVVVQREELKQLSTAIGQLPLLQQQLLQLRMSDGLRFAEIAILLGKREGAVRKLYSRTLAQLRTIYNQHERGDV